MNHLKAAAAACPAPGQKSWTSQWQGGWNHCPGYSHATIAPVLVLVVGVVIVIALGLLARSRNA